MFNGKEEYDECGSDDHDVRGDVDRYALHGDAVKNPKYVACSLCGELHDSDTIGRDFEGFGRRRLTPQGRWHGAAECKVVTFAIERPLCEKCGGQRVERQYAPNVHKNAAEAWKTVDPSSELGRLIPKYLRK